MMFLHFDIVHQQQAWGAVVVSFVAITVGFEAPVSWDITWDNPQKTVVATTYE